MNCFYAALLPFSAAYLPLLALCSSSPMSVSVASPMPVSVASPMPVSVAVGNATTGLK